MNKSEFWSLVVQRVSVSQVQIWVGNLSARSKQPYCAKVEIKQGDTFIESMDIVNWRKPFSSLSSRFYQLCIFQNLSVNTHYDVIFYVQDNSHEDWRVVNQAQFSTLPDSIPVAGQKPFVIALGSCFSNQDDDCQVSTAFSALYDKGEESVKPDITFLVGDQVYLDIGFASLVPVKSFIRNRIANRYEKNWRDLNGVFTRGATWMLPDDHEYWNDYPFNELPILALQALKLKSVRSAWEQAAADGVNNIQSSKMIEIIDIGQDLSICLANLRTERGANQFISDAEFTRLIDWAVRLQCPGVLVVQQLLMDVAGEGERSLPSFKEQYSRLLEALAESGNDIVVLSGDVHFGRVASVEFGTKGATYTEVVASPLSNLKGLLNGLASDVCNNKPEIFPNLRQPNLSLPARAVHYDDNYKVSHTSGKAWSVYPKDRTDEHFMTLSFSRVENNVLLLNVDAWRVRARDSLSGLPSKGFKQTYSVKLKKKVI